MLIMLMLILSGQVSSAGYNSCSFYIVAHQDDWQLFMGRDAWSDMVMPGRKVVIIYLTAGDACSGTGTCGSGVPYYVSRESGAKASVFAAKGEPTASTKLEPSSFNAVVWAGNHPVARWEYQNVVQYFFRLPDGRIHFKETSGSDCGLDLHDSTYLNFFRRGLIKKLSDIQGNAVYQGWSDLTRCILTLVTREMAASGNCIHTHEYSPILNRMTHSDHRETGLLAAAVGNQLPEVEIFYHVDYFTAEMVENLSVQEKNQESILFAAYNKKKTALGCPSDWSEAVIPWCSANYISRMVPGRVTSGEKPAGIAIFTGLQPNPSMGNTLLSLNLQEDEVVSCAIYDLRGEQVCNLLNKAALKKGTYRYPIGKLPAGIYILRLQTRSGCLLCEKVVFN